MDDTPTGAMRKLLGSSSRPHHPMKTERVVSATKSATLHTQPSSPTKLAATQPAIPVEQPTDVQPSVRVPSLDAEEVRALLRMLAQTPGNKDKTEVAKDKILLQTLERIEKAEKTAEQRELRLRMMLEEVSHRTISADDKARASCT